MSLSEKEKIAFVDAVYEIVKRIPFGRATSYGAIAKAVGYSNMSRKVGSIMGICNSEDNIPAHRVVNSQGVLSGRDAFGTSTKMQELLEAEGVVVVNNRIRDWKTIYWNPIEEISIE